MLAADPLNIEDKPENSFYFAWLFEMNNRT